MCRDGMGWNFNIESTDSDKNSNNYYYVGCQLKFIVKFTN